MSSQTTIIGTAAPHRLSMEEFNQACLECGLTPNEERNKEYNNEASYFTISHPLSDKPIPIAAYEDFIDDDDVFINVEIPRNQLNLALAGYEFNVISTNSAYRLTPKRIKEAIENMKAFLDKELEARKKTSVPFERFINYLGKTCSSWKNATVELSCPFDEFMQKIQEESVQLKVGNVSATFKQKEQP